MWSPHFEPPTGRSLVCLNPLLTIQLNSLFIIHLNSLFIIQLTQRFTSGELSRRIVSAVISRGITWSEGQSS